VPSSCRRRRKRTFAHVKLAATVSAVELPKGSIERMQARTRRENRALGWNLGELVGGIPLQELLESGVGGRVQGVHHRNRKDDPSASASNRTGSRRMR